MTSATRVGSAALAALLTVSLLVSCGVSRRDGGQSGGPKTSTTATSGTTKRADPTIEWSECGGSDCGEISVPLDYADPDGDTIKVAVLRASKADPDKRIGSLLLNPGGPGGSGNNFAEGMVFPAELTERFDIVGFDPRGVGKSTGLDCNSHLQEIYDADPTMEDQADKDHYLEVSQKFVDECEKKYADMLPHLGTENVARDLDEIRKALGDDKLNYLGYSYGTSIGQQYARLFPTHVRAMVLDGVVDVSVTGLEAADTQAKGFETALDAFIKDCDAKKCLEGGAEAVIKKVQAAAEKKPIPAPGMDRSATPGVVNLGMGQALYAKFLWPDLADALDEARKGDATGLVGLADDYLGREGDDYPPMFEIYFGVSCLDSEWPKDPNKVFAAAKETGKKYPLTGEALVNDYARCALWPGKPQPLKPIPKNVKGLAPIMLVSTTRDPATPYENGVNVAKAIPDAILLSYDGDGHTIFGQGDRCVDSAVIDYYEDPKPGKDISC